MDIKLGKDERAIIKWVYVRAKGFAKEHAYSVSLMKKELNMSEERYLRALSFLQELSLAGAQHGKADKPEEGDWIWLTAAGVNAYRNAVKQDEWDIVYDAEQFKKRAD